MEKKRELGDYANYFTKHEQKGNEFHKMVSIKKNSRRNDITEKSITPIKTQN